VSSARDRWIAVTDSCVRAHAGVRPLTETLYRLIGAHRGVASRVTTLLWGRNPQPSTYAVARWSFLRLLGVVYLAAFWSLGIQILGLVGRDGSCRRAWVTPGFVACASPDPCSRLLLIAGMAPVIVLPLLWAGYLWMSVVSGPFLSFQWDAVLLEAGFLAIFVAPLVLRERRRDATDPPRLLLTGSPQVLRLLARDPFEGHPPRAVRGILYRYRFSDASRTCGRCMVDPRSARCVFTGVVAARWEPDGRD